MENKPTLKEIEERLNDFIKDNKKEFDAILPKQYVWEEDGVTYSAWKIGNLMTGDGGKEMYDKALEKQLKESIDANREIY